MTMVATAPPAILVLVIGWLSRRRFPATVQSRHDPEDPCLPAARRQRYHRRFRSPGPSGRRRKTLRGGLAPWHAQRSLLLAARRHALAARGARPPEGRERLLRGDERAVPGAH